MSIGKSAQPISWDTVSFTVDGISAYLVSGEFHYFRVPKADWRKRLELFQVAGGNCVATYIPWGLHEPTEGDIRFGDIPQRELTCFLTLCKELGIWVICRPGPYSYSELLYDGLPGWLCENYPQLLARDCNNQIIRNSSISYLHPLFLEKAQRWMQAVCALLACHTASAGGAVAMVQLDNELMGVHTWFGSMDLHPETLEYGKEDGRLACYLRTKYGEINALNSAWGAQQEQFSSPLPISSSNQTADGFCIARQKKDIQTFSYEMAREYLTWLACSVRAAGIDCPLVHNSANPGMNSWFKEAVQGLGADFLLGSDHYYNLHQEWQQNNPTPQYALKVLYSNGQLRAWGYPPTVWEMPAGSCSDWPPITPHDLLCCYMLHVALDMKGLNYYIFTGGDNPEGLGRFGDIYDYGAPIGAYGEMRKSYEILRDFGNMLQQDNWLARSDRVLDFHVCFPNEYARADEYAAYIPSTVFAGDKAFALALKAILPSALCASYSAGILDLDRPLPADGLPLFVPCGVCMSRDAQERLVEHLCAGGKLILAPVLPHLDEDFMPCTILADYLGAQKPLPLPGVTVADIGTVHNVLHKQLYTCTFAHDAHPIGWERRSGTCIAWEKEWGNGGKAIYLGMDWMHSMHTHSQMLAYLLDRVCTQSPCVHCDNPNLWTALRTDGIHRRLFVMNLFASSMQAQIHVRGVYAPFSLSVEPMSVAYHDLVSETDQPE